MASFQVEIVPSSPFFQNNLNNLDIADLWVHQPQWQTAASTSAAATDAQCNNNNNNNTNNKKINNNNNNNNGEEGYGYEGEKGKDKWARAREIVFPANTSPPKASDNPNPNAGGVSSLVQKWKGFEAVAKRSSGGAPPPPPLPPGPLPIEDDSIIGDWESDRTVLSGRSSIRGRDSDATESERLRVADIIRKLTPNEAGSTSPPRLRTSLDQCLPGPGPVASSRVRSSFDHQSELRGIAPTPRIRGRQAYIDLLAQRERDRRKELQGLLDRNAVSKFSHRGRIQAVLKIKLLRRGMEAKEGRHANRNPFESPYKPPMHFRLRVNEKAQNGPVHLESCRKEAKDNTLANSNSVDDQVRKQEKQQQEVSNTKSTSSSCVRAREDGSQLECRASRHDDVDLQHNANLVHRYEEATTFIIREETRHGLAELVESAETNKHKDEDEEATAATNYELVHDSSSAHDPTVGMSCNVGGEQIVETAAAPYWIADFNSHPEDGWEELQSDYQTKDVNWIYEVSRPRSDWEYLRQERYQEMLDPFSENEEIRALLGRKSVSSFLSSGMREKIDQLMISRSQGQEQSLNYNNDNDNKNQRQEKRRQVVLEEGIGEDQYGGYFDEYEEAESSKGQQQFTTECDEYVDPTIPQNANANGNGNGNGNGNQGHESSDQCSFQAVSPSTQQSSTNYLSLDMTGRHSSYSTHPTFDMEIIYDLRRHMEQLHQEISELRKSIKCCTDMQIKLHRSIKKEVSVALIHPDAKNGRRHPVKKGTSGRRCCLCSKMQVDCVLYKCGHMCTCFDCANQLHWSTGRCPVCRAQILDVVRLHSNS